MLSSYASDAANKRRNFLHSIPSEIDAKYKLESLLETCTRSNRTREEEEKETAEAQVTKHKNRFSIIYELIQVFESILDEHRKS